MILILHILIALSSVGFATYTFGRPTRSKLYVAFGLVGSTLVSGFYLTMIHPTHMAEACIMGITYVCAVSYLLLTTARKLARETVDRSRG